MELTINGKVTLDVSPQLMAALSALAAAFGKDAPSQPEVRKEAVKIEEPQPEVKKEAAKTEEPQPEVKKEPKPSIITDAELREHTSAAVRRASKETVLAILMKVGNTNKITDLNQEQRNQFLPLIQAL